MFVHAGHRLHDYKNGRSLGKQKSVKVAAHAPAAHNEVLENCDTNLKRIYTITILVI